MKERLPNQRWQIFPFDQKKVEKIVELTGLSSTVAQVVINRGIENIEEALIHIDPESQNLPSPIDEFPDLAISIELIKEAIESNEIIAICGDYDADGMTSTALLLRALKHFGAKADYAIPSRMKDGYGINERIVEEFADNGVGLILTVDNGISANAPITRAVELGMSVIITDHHNPPETLPPADAILNPKLIPLTSPYRGLAGVGVAYILAISTAQSLGKLQGLTEQLLELFTLGTIADLAPLIGVNRRWLKRGLRRLANSKLTGVQALIDVSKVREKKQLKPDDIGFKLGPRINAVGRLSDPDIVIQLLTTEDGKLALEKAIECENLNLKRQQLCQEIEDEAKSLIEQTPIDYLGDRVLVVINKKWHHGAIGIVASRLVERYGVPVFIGTYEEDDETNLRGSARGIEEFHVFKALEFCDDLLTKYGGHKAAGGFSLLTKNLPDFKKRLIQFAYQCLEENHLKPLIKIDTQTPFNELNFNLYRQIDSLQPWGIENEFPVFWTPNVRVLEQRIVGTNHLKLTLADDTTEIKGIAWRWGDYYPLPQLLDVAYKIQENSWNDTKTIEIELIGARIPNHNSGKKPAVFQYNDSSYVAHLVSDSKELRIENHRGDLLTLIKGQKTGILKTKSKLINVNVTKPYYYQLIKAALQALS